MIVRYENMTLNERRKFAWNVLLYKYGTLWQSLKGEAKKKTLSNKFEKLMKLPINERLTALADIKFRKKFKLKAKKKFLTSRQLLKDFNFGQ